MHPYTSTDLSMLIFYSVGKELGEKLDDAEQVETTPEEQEVIEEEDAKSRLTFEPVGKIFDDRKGGSRICRSAAG